MNCSICSDAKGRSYEATETMLGMGGRFFYWECSGCGCLRLENPPANLADYYPSDYYSMVNHMKRGWHTKLADFCRVTNTPFVSNFVRRFRPDRKMASLAPLYRGDRILDVGCGSGDAVFRLRQLGFNAIGVDPFVSQDIYDDGHLRVKRAELKDIAETFTVILLSHSLEHMPNQFDAVAQVKHHLAKNGRAVIRIPLALADWKEKRAHWWELDPPRHFFLHTPKSLAILAGQVGLRITRTIFDSLNHQRNREGSAERASFTLISA